MRINKYVALATGMSRRAADTAILANRILLNGEVPAQGAKVGARDTVTLDGEWISNVVATITIMLNKPVGYVCSRDGQGSRTIYDLLPPELQQLKPVGRLDKDSSGLILLTNDGDLANRLTHPSFEKEKVYHIKLHSPLKAADQLAIQSGVSLHDGKSALRLKSLAPDHKTWEVRMHEGRNRQIRRTFSARGYRVIDLHRTEFGSFALDKTPLGSYASALKPTDSFAPRLIKPTSFR